MRSGDTATFNTKKFETSVAEMKAKKEEVHDRGKEVFRLTGKLDPLVDIQGQLRVSHNSMEKSDSQAILKLGIALPIWSGFDGTGSMAENSSRAHAALGRIHAMLTALKPRYNVQLSASVIQDVCDPHFPYQQTQFESDERTAEQLRLLIPDGDGGDPTEDYQFALAYLMMAVDTDIFNFYGLKGYGFIIGDQIGRESVTVDGVKTYLGHTLQSTMTTKAVAQLLLPKWHMFYIKVGSKGTGGSRDHVTSWWEDKLGSNHVVICEDPELMAEIQCGLIYVTETIQPTESGLFEFLTAGGANKKIGEGDAHRIWSWIVEAGVEFGAQTKLPGYSEIPLPGAIFEHYRHQWPIGHINFSKNVIPVDRRSASIDVLGKTPSKTNWGKF